MSRVVEEVQETEEQANQFSDITEPNENEEAATNEAQQTQDNSTENDYELPSKFQGKSVEDIVQSYENLEKELGRKGQEVGELRKLTDQILQQQLATQSGTKEPEAEEVDFFDDPNKAVSNAIENHPKFRELEEQSKAQAAAATTQQLQAAHPDYLDVIQDPKFQEWVQESPIRTQLYVQAHNYDLASAMEIIGNWKERKLISNTQEAEAAKESKREADLKAGKTVTRTSSESTAGKKIYRRADLIRLKATDPARYEALQDEILQAYSDGRVR